MNDDDDEMKYGTLDSNFTYGSLPTKFRGHRRGLSESGRSFTMETKSGDPPTSAGNQRKTSVLSGLANKLKFAFDNKKTPSSELNHRRLRSTLSDLAGRGSSESLDDAQFYRKRSSIFRPRMFKSLYSSQRRPSNAIKASKSSPDTKKIESQINYIQNNNHILNSKFNFANSCGSSSGSSTPSSPEFRRTQSYDERFNPDVVSIKSTKSTTSETRRQEKYSSKRYRKKQESQKTSKTQTKMRLEIEETSQEAIESVGTSDIRLVVMGTERVGKSAIIVRYLTKRFIGEYAPCVESINRQRIHADGKEIQLHLWDSTMPELRQLPSDNVTNQSLDEETDDTAFKSVSSASSSASLFSSTEDLEEEAVENQAMDLCNRNQQVLERLVWADGVVLVYSICDKDSFKAVQNMVRFIRGHTCRDHSRQFMQSLSTPNHRDVKRDSGFLSGAGSRPGSGSCELSPVSSESPVSPTEKPPISQMPILLLGNMSDLHLRRVVSAKECRVFAMGYGCLARELSASESYEPVCEAFSEITDAVLKSTIPSTITRLGTMFRKIRHRRNKST